MNATLIEIGKMPPDRSLLEPLIDKILIEHPRAHVASGQNMLDDPAMAGRIESSNYYVFET